MFLPQPENYRNLWNAKLFSVAHPFDEDTGKGDIFWLASIGVSEITSQQKLTRSDMLGQAIEVLLKQQQRKT